MGRWKNIEEIINKYPDYGNELKYHTIEKSLQKLEGFKNTHNLPKQKFALYLRVINNTNTFFP
jgi:hypothetical protein